MSAAAGAPPPPPPPSRSSKFDDLPAELLLILYDLLGLEDFMNLALVIYPTLRRHRMVPELTNDTFSRMINEAVDREMYGTSPAVARMPVELWMEIAQDLQPANGIALVFALGSRFWRFPRDPSRELCRWLRVWSARSSRNRKLGPK